MISLMNGCDSAADSKRTSGGVRLSECASQMAAECAHAERCIARLRHNTHSVDSHLDDYNADDKLSTTNSSSGVGDDDVITNIDDATLTPQQHQHQCGYPKRTRSLVDDAKFDTARNRELHEERRALAERIRQRNDSRSSRLDESCEINNNNNAVEQLTSADIFLKKHTQQDDDAQLSQDDDDDDDVDELEQRASLLELLTQPKRSFADFPRHVSQLDECNHLLIKYEPELDPTHPGYHDLEYRQRRKQVAQIAFDYKYGERIPDIAYTQKEIDTWRTIYVRLKRAYEKYACRQHNDAIAQLEQHCGYSPNRIPQLQQVSDYLERTSGWRLRPAAGLLTARDFLASLAHRVFQTTQYIRHWGNPEHSVEPDCIHELMGHIPMLCDPSFARFSQEIGLASLGASDEQIERFATLYWFTVEFGLCRERGQLKCYGAGLLSSYGEMEHALESNKPTLKEFVPEQTAVEAYDDAEYQVTYYVAQSFDDAKDKIKAYAAKHLHRDFELAYDPYTCTVRVLDSFAELEAFCEQTKNDVARLSCAVAKLSAREARFKHQVAAVVAASKAADEHAPNGNAAAAAAAEPTKQAAAANGY